MDGNVANKKDEHVILFPVRFKANVDCGNIEKKRDLLKKIARRYIIQNPDRDSIIIESTDKSLIEENRFNEKDYYFDTNISQA